MESRFKDFLGASVAAAAVAMLCSGCASIVSGSTQTVSFQSNPSGATVKVDGRVLGVTPMSLPLKRDQYNFAEFDKDGFQPLTLPMNSSVNGWFWGNILCGGLFGSTTDGASGAMYEYSPNQYMASLVPLQASTMESDTLKSPRQKAKDFIVVAYTGLTDQLRAGSGVYVTSLLDLLKVPKAQRRSATKKIAALAEAYTDIPDFADHVVDLYLGPESAAPAAAPAPALKPSTMADWEAVKHDDEPAEQYHVLVTLDPTQLSTAVSELPSYSKRALTDYIVSYKGQKESFSWRFDVMSTLPDPEKKFIATYLSQFTNYKPVVAGN